MTNASLHWIDDEGKERQVLLDAVETILGRRTGADIELINKRVSREHAKIKKTQHGYLLLDLASQYGTCVNGQPVGHHSFETETESSCPIIRSRFSFVREQDQNKPATPPSLILLRHHPRKSFRF